VSVEANGAVTDPFEPSWSYRPLQSFLKQRSSGRIGLPAPGAASALAERLTLPVFLPLPAPKDATPWAILSWGSVLLHGVSRCYSSSASRPKTPLLGFRCPFSARGERVHVPVRLPFLGSLVVPGGSSAVPIWLITVPLAGFPNLSADCSSLCRPAIFRRVALVGLCPSGSCSFHEAPTTRHRRHALLTLIPSNWPVPVLGGNVRGRWNRCLGQSGCSHFVSSGPSSSWKSVCSSSQD
jgi:hypothetical protein